MIEVRWHGRGGQGAVTSVELLALAAIEEGKYAQGFPAFGPERRGAPVMAYNRVSEKPIKIRSGIYHPDVVVVLDPSLIGLVNVTEGLKPGGLLVVNTAKPEKEIREKLNYAGRLATVGAGGPHRQHDHAGGGAQGHEDPEVRVPQRPDRRALRPDRSQKRKCLEAGLQRRQNIQVKY